MTKFAALVFSLVVIVSSAAAAAGDKTAIPLWPQAGTALPAGDDPAPAAFWFGSVEGINPALLADVAAEGYVRVVAVETETIGQVMIVSVSRAGKSVPLETAGLAGQFDAAGMAALSPETAVQVEGDRAALLAALERLEEQVPAEKKAGRGADDAPMPPAAKSRNDAQNEQAANWKAPTVLKTTYRTTTEGCPVRYDLLTMRAIVTAKQETYVDGSKTNESPCGDSGTAYPLTRSYLSCPDKIDVASKTAWPQYALVYVDGNAATQKIAECAPDKEQAYKLFEDESACTVDLDFTRKTATPRAALVYTDSTGRLVQVRSCEASQKAIPLKQDLASCPLRHDYKKGLSYELAALTYERGGRVYQAQPCVETGKTYKHETVYTDAANAFVCTPITVRNQVTMQSRTRISINKQPQYISECTPDKTSQTVAATTEGCDDPAAWTHNLAAGVSYGHERYYFIDPDGKTRRYVTDCQASKTAYKHQQALAGYQYNDAALFAYALKTASIETPKGPYTIATAQVLPGSQQLSYVKEPSRDEPTGKTVYEDGNCMAFAATLRREVFTRPDGTEYVRPAGPGTPIPAGDACTRKLPRDPAQWKSQGYQADGLSLTWWIGYRKGKNGYMKGEYVETCPYTADVKVIREDGKRIGSFVERRLTNKSKYFDLPPGEKPLSFNQLVPEDGIKTDFPYAFTNEVVPQVRYSLKRFLFCLDPQPPQSEVSRWLDEAGQ